MPMADAIVSARQQMIVLAPVPTRYPSEAKLPILPNRPILPPVPPVLPILPLLPK